MRIHLLCAVAEPEYQRIMAHTFALLHCRFVTPSLDSEV